MQRLTTATMYGSLLNSLQSSLRNIQDLQTQIASGNKYTKLSDNPTAIAQALKIESALNSNEQYQQNNQNAITMLSYADSALNNVLDATKDIRTLVIQAGDGALDETQLDDIVASINAKKQVIVDSLNSRVAGQYIFGGTDTSTPPFTLTADGSVVYNGNDERIKYTLADGLLGDVTFAGSEIIPTDEDSYFICSHNVPLDWLWTGREEKVQITVGNRTLSVFIPEDWIDEVATKTSSDDSNVTDYNRFRDPGEVTGISLDDLASLVNRSLSEQGASMLVTAYVEKDTNTNQQQLILKSNTTEKIGITGWSDTDYLPMAQSISSVNIDGNIPDWSQSNDKDAVNGLMGNANLLNWRGGDNSGKLTITLDGNDYDIDLTGMNSVTELTKAINEAVPSNAEAGAMPVASLSVGISGRLVLQSSRGEISVSGDEDVMSEIFGSDSGGVTLNGTTTITSSKSTISVQSGTEPAVKIYINNDDNLSSIAGKINSINGIYSRISSNNNQMIITAQRIGDQPEDRLSVDAAAESLHYPKLTITGTGGALELFSFEDDGTVEKNTEGEIISGMIISKQETRPVDHSHMDVFDYLGMETAMKSREFAIDEKLTVTSDTQLHWRVMSGGKTADIKLNPGEYSLTDLADRLKNAGAGWLEVTVDVFNPDEDEINADETESGVVTTNNHEEQTQRLVIRGYNGEQVLFIDMNDQNYADILGLSTAVRTDAYTTDDNGNTIPGTGMRCVNFPSAPCVDDNIGVNLRVQMNCGMYYDITVSKSAVMNNSTGFVDRNKFMKEIANQVNKIEGREIMGVTVHVNKSGKEIDDSAALYFLSGEAFTVVDMPFSDPEWGDYSGGLAAQLGIHGGVTSNLAQTQYKMLDNAKFEDYANFPTDGGTIKFSNLAHSVEIDVSPEDTVKDVMDRLRVQAGDWLYVNYYDTHMGQDDVRNTGDYPIIAISSVDGSAVSITDSKGNIAQDYLGISTGIQTRVDGGMSQFDWNDGTTTNANNANVLRITVAGYSHDIDLAAMRDVTDDEEIKADDLAEFINARFQDYDVQARINDDDQLVIWSPRGYAIKMDFLDDNGDSVTRSFLGSEPLNATYYRGGYNLEADASTRGLEFDDNGEVVMYSSSIHSQNATIRSGANTMRQNAFGTLNDITAAIKSGNRLDLEEKMLPRLDNFINNLLGVMSSAGAMRDRYEANTDKLITENAIMAEDYDSKVKIDPADAISQLMVADYMYQANLAVISRLIQPTLLDFLS